MRSSVLLLSFGKALRWGSRCSKVAPEETAWTKLLSVSEEGGPVDRDEHFYSIEPELTFFGELASEDQDRRCIADSHEDSSD